MLQNKKFVAAMIFAILLGTANITFAGDNRQYMQTYHQQQVEKAQRQRAQYEAATYSNGNRRGLADIVGGSNESERYDGTSQRVRSDQNGNLIFSAEEPTERIYWKQW